MLLTIVTAFPLYWVLEASNDTRVILYPRHIGLIKSSHLWRHCTDLSRTFGCQRGEFLTWSSNFLSFTSVTSEDIRQLGSHPADVNLSRAAVKRDNLSSPQNTFVKQLSDRLFRNGNNRAQYCSSSGNLFHMVLTVKVIHGRSCFFFFCVSL